MKRFLILGVFPVFASLLLSAPLASAQADSGAKPPVKLLRLQDADTDPTAIAYEKLPEIEGQHAVIHAADATLKFQLHNYLVHHDGKLWCMWSQGPEVEDVPSQQVRYATSEDGLSWSQPQTITGLPTEGYAYIARGFWQREGELLALVAHFKGKGAFGVNKELELRAFAWDAPSAAWKPKGLVYENAINNFPPQKLSTGEWMMTRRDSRFNVSMLGGGVKSLNDWQSYPVVERNKVKGFSPDEPIWWEAANNTLVGLFRDNGGSQRLFHATSQDLGKTWTLPTPSNFPNASSKIFSLPVSGGYRVLIGNANPAVGRRQIYLAISQDGLTFNHLARLAIPSPRPATLQYPHAIEHDGHLLICFSRNKVQSELLKVSLKNLANLQRPGP
jgi:hypothetical protein